MCDVNIFSRESEKQFLFVSIIISLLFVISCSGFEIIYGMKKKNNRFFRFNERVTLPLRDSLFSPVNKSIHTGNPAQKKKVLSGRRIISGGQVV